MLFNYIFFIGIHLIRFKNNKKYQKWVESLIQSRTDNFFKIINYLYFWRYENIFDKEGCSEVIQWNFVVNKKMDSFCSFYQFFTLPIILDPKRQNKNCLCVYASDTITLQRKSRSTLGVFFNNFFSENLIDFQNF